MAFKGLKLWTNFETHPGTTRINQESHITQKNFPFSTKLSLRMQIVFINYWLQ